MVIHCYYPDEQHFDLNDRVIGIDWGKNGDFAIQTTIMKGENGIFEITEVKVLDNGRSVIDD